MKKKQRHRTVPENLNPRTILVTRDSRVGDVLMATPAIRRLKDRFPDAAIDILVSPYAKRSGVLARNPAIRRIYTCPRTPLMRRLRCLILPRYDLVILMRRRKEFEWIRSKVTVDCDTPPRSTHVVHRSEQALGFDIDERFVPMEIYPSEEEIEQAAREFPNPVVAIYGSCHNSPVSSGTVVGSSRAWRAELLSATMRLLQDAGYKVVLFGGNRAEADALVDLSLDVPVFRGGSITLMAARFARLAALITVDTGPMHVAAAVDIPIVALYGPTNPDVTCPYSFSGRSVILRDTSLECSPCRGKRLKCRNNVCMTFHTPERILAALTGLIGQPEGRC